MPATLLDGKLVSQQVLDRCAQRVKTIKDKTGVHGWLSRPSVKGLGMKHAAEASGRP